MTAGDRYVLAGLARARSDWFRRVGAWTTSQALPAEFVKCVSAEELRAHLAGTRPFSAVLLDAGLPATDRDLLAAVRDAGAVPIVVDSRGVDRRWPSLGAGAVLSTDFDRAQLLDVLGAHASRIGGGHTVPSEVDPSLEGAAEPCPVLLVCGPGGTGASTVAIALAQGLAATETTAGSVLLADFCLRADQAMLHDARDVVPGVQELVEDHRGRRASTAEVHAHTFEVVERGYQLLLGLRRARYWSAIRPRAFEVAFDALRQTFGVLVCDVTSDFESESDGGSIDVEERNVMARTVAAHSSAAVAVGTTGIKGLHALVGLLGDLRAAGVADERVVPVCNGAPRLPRARAAYTRALADLDPAPARQSPVFLPRRKIDEALRDGVALPEPMPTLLVGGVTAALRRTRGRSAPDHAAPQRLAPGSLGAWSSAPER